MQRPIRSMLTAGLALCVFSLLGLVFVDISPAHGCSLAPTYSLPSEVLAGGDFNQPDGALAHYHHTESYFRNEPVPKILGAYRTEVIASVEPIALGTKGENGGSMEISRGSISVVTDYWGQAPDDFGPSAIGRPHIWERVPDTGACEFLGYPPNRPTGTVFHAAITSSGEEITLMGADLSIDDDLDAGFGPRTSPPRNLAEERALLAELQAERDTALDEADDGWSRLPLFGGALGLALLGGFGVLLKVQRG